MRSQQKVFLGEIGEIVLTKPLTIEPLIGVDLDDESITYRELCGLALQCNIDVKEIIGVKTCMEHYEHYVLLAGKEMPEGYNLFEHCVYCRNCFQFFRWEKL